MKIFFESKNLVDEELKFVLNDTDIVNDTWRTHWEDSLEILHGIKGEARIMVGKESYSLQSGDTIIINSQTLHNSSSDVFAYYYCLKIKSEWFKDNGIDIKTVRFENFIQDPVIVQLFDELKKQHVKTVDLTYIPSLKRALLNLVIYLLENYSHETENRVQSKGFATVLDVMTYITEHYSEHIGIDELAAKFGYSKYHFLRLFKQNTGQTVVDYINAMRCEVAGELLRKGTLPVAEIAYTCGFNTPSYFAKQFKKFYGVLPVQYRKEKRNLKNLQAT